MSEDTITPAVTDDAVATPVEETKEVVAEEVATEAEAPTEEVVA